MYVTSIKNPRPVADSRVQFHVNYRKGNDKPIELLVRLPTGVYDYNVPLTWQEWEEMDFWLHQQLLG